MALESAAVVGEPCAGAKPALHGQAQLTPEQRGLVRAIVESVLPGALVRIFGSRATRKARPFSDLDLLFERPDRLTLAERAALRDCFEASVLPFRVDLVEAAGLPQGMRERVRAEALEL